MNNTKHYISAEFNYHLLRNALSSFNKNLSELSRDEHQQIYKKAVNTFDLEQLVIHAPEAMDVVIPDSQIEHAFEEVASRYSDDKEFLHDLQLNGLDESSLRTALYRELLFDAVMQLVSIKVPAVTDLDVRLFYEMHQQQFILTEKRTARHILITINPEFAENTEDMALQRITDIKQQLEGHIEKFQQFAKLHSECPTALEEGKLGDIQQGQLYPELDSILFQMQAKQISDPIKTRIGYHLLLCEAIKPGKHLLLEDVSGRIREILQARHRRHRQREWLNQLKSK